MAKPGVTPKASRSLIAVSGGFLTLFMCVMIILYIHKSPHDCRFVGAELITQPTSPRQAVFTAEVVSSGWVRPITRACFKNRFGLSLSTYA